MGRPWRVMSVGADREQDLSADHMFFLRVRAQPIPRRHASHAGTTRAHSTSPCGHHVPLRALAVVRISVRVLRSTPGTAPEAVRPVLHVHAPPPTRPWDTATIGNAPRLPSCSAARPGLSIVCCDLDGGPSRDPRRGSTPCADGRARHTAMSCEWAMFPAEAPAQPVSPSVSTGLARFSARGIRPRTYVDSGPSPLALWSARLHQAPPKTNAAQKDGALHGADPFGALADWRPRRSARSGARLDV